MSKYAKGILALLVVGLLVWAAIIYKEPKEDITKIINTTGMPLQLPPGASISIFAKDLPGARVLAWDPVGSLLVSMPDEGRIVALIDADGDRVSEAQKIVISNLRKPHGLAFDCRTEPCTLYIAEEHQVATYSYDATEQKATFKKKVADLPTGGGHTTRTIIFRPEPFSSQLLISVGSSCNVCRESDARRAKVLVVDVDAPNPAVTVKPFAVGLRNSVFMAIHPVSGEIWATEMGRDLLGDNLPPDEINIIGEGNNYGWPICYGDNMHDQEFDKNTYIRNPCMEPFEAPSYIDIPAHSAPLGIAFIPEEGWPEAWWYNAIVAYHGSWNRSTPTGYKLVRYKLDAEGTYQGEEDFITGWLKGGDALGRPVDIVTQPGGSMYVSDDKAGVIYRIVVR